VNDDKSIDPLPAIEPISSSAPNSYIAPLSTVSAVVFDNDPLTFSFPASTVVAPVYVLAPLTVHVPLPAFVRPPAPVPITLARLLPLLVPPNVKPNPDPTIVPTFDKSIFPLLATTLLSAPSVSSPLYATAVAELFVNAPPDEIPVPFSVSPSAIASV